MVMDVTANPSAAPLAGGATTPGSRFGGMSWKAQLLKLIARVGRHMTGFAYRELRKMELEREHQPAGDHRAGTAGLPSRAAGGPAPGEYHPSR